MACGKQVMPVGPTTRSDWLVGFLAWLDSHVRHPALFLPMRKTIRNKLFDKAFSLHVLLTDGAEFVVEFLSLGFWAHPMDGVEPFLENIPFARLELGLFPEAQSISTRPVRTAKIAAQRRNLCS